MGEDRVQFLFMVNPKSGGNDGANLIRKLRDHAVEDGRIYVHDLMEKDENGRPQGPEGALRRFANGNPRLRIMACGGDGTVGWVLKVMQDMNLEDRNRPPIGIIPLGTGNDLSRTLDWGRHFTSRKPVQKYIKDLATARINLVDQWRLKANFEPSDNHRYEGSEEFSVKYALDTDIFNNYFSLGIDAHIALNFHEERNRNPEKFNSRTKNLLFYGLMGTKDLFKNRWRRLTESITLELDGEDYTEKIRRYKAHAILFLNIPCYGGGSKPMGDIKKAWEKKKKRSTTTTEGAAVAGAPAAAAGAAVAGAVAGAAAPAPAAAAPAAETQKEEGPPLEEVMIGDGFLDVVIIDNLDLAVLQAGGSGCHVKRCKHARLTTSMPIPVQLDGEPMCLGPCAIDIVFNRQSKMLRRSKKTDYSDVPVVEAWAAQQIQSSFKQYKNKGGRRAPRGAEGGAAGPAPPTKE